MTVSGNVWSAQDTTPSEVAAALRELLKQRHAESEAYAPARVLNLVVVADREWRGEIQNRLDQVGRYHASRTILCCVEPGRRRIDGWATMTAEEEPKPGQLAVAHEQVVLDVGPQHLARLDTIVDPMVVTDLATLVWSPHGHPEAVDALLDLAQIVLIDSVNEPDPAAAVRRAKQLAARAYIVDLAWLRSTPWRERVASTFDPAQWRPELAKISAVTARHRPDSTVAGLLFFGWLAKRLGWECGGMVAQDGSMHGLGARAPAGRPAAAGARPDHERSGAGRCDHRDGLGHQHRAQSRPRRAHGTAADPRRQRVGVDGHGRLARRGGDPGRGDPPGAAARQGLRAGSQRGRDDGVVTSHQPGAGRMSRPSR